MKRLQDKVNVDAPGGAYPYGKSKDDAGGNTGTPLDFERFNDWDQFIERMMDQSGIVANGLPDNSTNDFQIYEAFRQLVGPYKVYAAKFSQSGVSNPTVEVIHNQLSATVVWSRTAPGTYSGTLVGAFPESKFMCFVNNNLVETQQLLVRVSDDSVLMFTHAFGDPLLTGSDGKLLNTEIEIRVYD